MDKRVYLFTVLAFIVGMVELIIGGILDLVAEDLHISIGQAGILITVFSLVFAIAGPLLIVATAGLERRELTLLALMVFLFGNLLAVFSGAYTILMASRGVTASSGALLIMFLIIIAS